MLRITDLIETLRVRKDVRWMTIWCMGTGAIFLWDALFLHSPAFHRLGTAFLQTLLGSALTVVLALVFGWGAGTGRVLLDARGATTGGLALSFAVNLFRSVPQIVGMLGGYIVLTLMSGGDMGVRPVDQIMWMAFVTALLVFPEVSDVIQERVAYYRSRDFVDALLCSGVSESRIVNVEILYRNCIPHLLQKLVGIFGTAVFLQCSVDFIVSVGLSTEVSLSNVPVTLGSMLARMDSKQDILAVSTLFSDPSYAPNLFLRHLQGVSVSLLIVLTLLSAFQIADGITRRLQGDA